MKKLNSQFSVFTIVIFIILSSCAVVKKKYHRDLVHKSILGSPILSSHFTGYVVYDPSDSTYLYKRNEDKLFTPSSNTKLLTFFTGLKMLEDSLPGLKYELRGDSLFFTGTGDPTFLHWAFPEQRIYDFLNDTSKVLTYIRTPFEDDQFAPGWSWEDYEYYFQVERSGFPIYGNTIGFEYDTINDQFSTKPDFFADFVEIREINAPRYQPNRQLDYNIFSFAPDTARSEYKNRVPFKTSDELVVALLEDTLNTKVHYRDSFDWQNPKLRYSLPKLDLFAFMLKISDNFVAEQIHYMCAIESNMDMQSVETRSYIENNYFRQKSLDPIWVDGSGLSRYNLVSPRMMIEIMKEISDAISIDTFKQTMAVGGVDGTLKDWYVPQIGEEPYVFGKTGTHRNNHSLTGIITTKSGRDLFFCFMNNNYPSGSTPIKQEMQKTLRMIYEQF